MSITSVVNDLVTSVSVINALKPLPPTISGYSVGGVDDTALDPAGGQTVQINGTGFLPGATITFDGSAVAVVTYVSPNQLTFTSPAKSAGTYTIYVVNSDGGTAIYIPGIIYSVLPTWTTSAGSLGSYYETTSISNTVVASGDAPITYSLFSGSLPTGASLAANGVITGTAPVDSSSTTYSFTIQATDAQLQDSTRSFSLTINTDVVTWVSPANATTYTSAVDSAIANVTLDATDAAGYAVTYSANALPTGLSLSGANISGTPTVIADSSTLLTATAATTNRTATRTINWSITVANDPYFEYNTLLIPGASTTFVDDASTNNFAVTINGDTKPNSFNPYTPGYYSNYFDGTGDYLTVPVSTALALSANYTIECWIYTTVAGQKGIYTSIDNTGDPWQGVGFEIYTNNCPRAVGWSGGSSSMDLVHQTSVVLNTWNHIALCRNNNLTYLYLNGVQSNTSSSDSTSYAQSGSTIGQQYPGSSQPFTGYISNLRVVKGTAVYTAAFTPPTSPLTAIANTSLLTCQSNRIIDNSTNAFTLTVGGDTSVKSFDPFVPNNSYSTYGSGYFDGTGDYLSIPSNSALQLPTGDFTIEAWIYLTGALGSYYFIFTQTSTTNATSNWDFIVNGNASGQLRFEAFSGGTQIINLIGTSSVPVNAWTHVAVTRSGSTYTIWMNGISQGTASSASTVNTNALTTYIGQNSNNTYYFPGYITDARIVKGTAVYTTAFTPPSAPLTAITNTQLLTLQNNQSVNNSTFLDNSTNNFLVTRAGNATQGTFSPYGGNWSNYFGSANYISAPSNAAFGFGTGDFTVEAWVFPNAAYTTYNYIYTTGVTNGLVFYVLGGVLYVRQYGASDLLASSTAPALNTWTHVAATRSGTTLRIFVNGVQTGTTTNSTNFATGSGFVGNDGTNVAPWLGYISNLRVVKGTAVYTSNFTPSTTPLTAISGTSLLTCQSNRLIDNSINNFAITKVGDTSVQRFSPFNPSSVTPTSYSGYFDGTGDMIQTPSITIGTNAFCFECWLYPTVTQGTTTGIFVGSATNSLQASYYGNPGLGIATKGTAWQLYEETTLPTVNAWNHVAFVRSGTGANQTSIYINGVRVANGTVASNFAASVYQISTTNAGGSVFQGYISNARLTNGSTPYDATQSTITVPTSPLTAISGTSLLTCQSPTFIDNSTNNFAITANGNSQPTIQNPFGSTSATTEGYTVSTIGGSGYFDGTDYLDAGGQTAFAFGTGDLTFECWIYATVANDTPIYESRSTSSNTNGFTVTALSSTVIRVYTSGVLVSATVSNYLSTWTHIAFTRQGSTNRLFINGVLGSTATSSDNFSYASAIIGGGRYLNNNISAYFTGYITDVRLVKGTALYTSSFVLPSAPLTAVQNTALLTNMTSAGIYDAAMMTTMETIGNPLLSTAVSKFGGSSMSFGGSQSILFPGSSMPSGAGSAFTVEFWINASSYNAITIMRANGNGSSLAFSTNSSSQFVVSNVFASDFYTSTTALSPNVWTHVAIVRNSANLYTIYFNGTSAGTAVTYNGVLGTVTQMYIAYNTYTGGYSTFYMDDLRITKGYARYTSNFTPPTSAFQLF